jgi:hypothetical protein
MLLAFVTVCCVVFAIQSPWGAPPLRHVHDRNQETYHAFPTTSAGEVLPALGILGGATLALVLGPVFYHLRSRKAFAIWACLSAMCFVAVVWALAMEITPLRDTEMRQVGLDQVLYVVLLTIGLSAPPAAFLGWYSATVLPPED